jgi:cell wall-associated NlpC family hydrolase
LSKDEEIKIAAEVSGRQDTIKAAPADTVHNHTATLSLPQSGRTINTGTTSPNELLNYAKTLIGTPYRYGSIDPKVGFDCSGFITHVFNHFQIAVPRSSIDFTHVDREINVEQAKPGDLVLFTGTDSAIRDVGHMGIITDHIGNEIHFIHSTSGKAHGVTITPLNKYYLGRFVKVLRVFKQNDQ